MSDHNPPLTASEASAILADIDRLVISTHPEVIMAVFRALVVLDVQRIAERARRFIALSDPVDLLDSRLGPDERAHRLRMDCFLASMAEYLVEKCPEIAAPADPDLPAWIATKAPTLVWANLRCMESHLPAHDPRSSRALIGLHRLIDLEACEAEQTRALLDAWMAIEAWIAGAAAGQAGSRVAWMAETDRGVPLGRKPNGLQRPRMDRGARSGEKLGWIGGWAGAFAWILVLAILLGARGQYPESLVGLGLAGLGFGSALVLTPWRFPLTPYWRLMLAPYLVLMASVPWAIWALAVPDQAPLSWWLVPTLVPLLLPILSMGRRRWCDGLDPLSSSVEGPSGATNARSPPRP
jgi:hypothetical protein